MTEITAILARKFVEGGYVAEGDLMVHAEAGFTAAFVPNQGGAFVHIYRGTKCVTSVFYVDAEDAETIRW